MVRGTQDMLGDSIYENLSKTLNQHLGEVYEEFTIHGADLNDIETALSDAYEVVRDEDSELYIFSDNVFASLEEDSEKNMVRGAISQDLKSLLLGGESTYRDRKIMDLPKTF